jgi:hypothetical protein
LKWASWCGEEEEEKPVSLPSERVILLQTNYVGSHDISNSPDVILHFMNSHSCCVLTASV